MSATKVDPLTKTAEATALDRLMLVGRKFFEFADSKWEFLGETVFLDYNEWT
jgi:hypothetical protein